MIAAPPKTPPAPKGRNGVQLAGLIWPKPTMRKNTITASLIVTMMLLILALSEVPRISRAVITKMMRKAGRLMIPPAKGEAVSDLGNTIPKAHLRRDVRTHDQQIL